MNTNFFDQNDQEQRRKSPGLSDFKKSYDNAKKIYQYSKKTIQAIRLIVSSFSAGWLIAAILIIVVLLFLFIMFFGIAAPIPGGKLPEFNGEEGSQTTPNIPGLKVTVSGPEQVNNGDEIRYDVTVTYDESQSQIKLSDIELFADTPENATLVSQNGVNTSSNPLVWPLSNSQNLQFSVILKPTQNDTIVTFKVSARNKGGGGGPGTGGSQTGPIAPTADNCNGKYDLSNPTNSNFGDPTCDFDEDALHTHLKDISPGHADFWYACARIESSYNPNAWRDPTLEPQTPDPAGAWGLFQMGRGRNHAEHDRGDVDWKKQASNAINYSKLISSFKAYWDCARQLDYNEPT